MPGEVTAGAVNEGSVSGDVNLFTGTYDLTHTLGSVSGINGPSFTLTASYSSVATSGTLVPSYKGYPMGEGWSLNLPTVSCSVEDYEKYNSSQRDSYSDEGPTESICFTSRMRFRKKRLFTSSMLIIPYLVLEVESLSTNTQLEYDIISAPTLLTPL